MFPLQIHQLSDKLATRLNHRDVALWLWAQGRSSAGAQPHRGNPSPAPAPSPAAAGRESPATPIQPWAGGVSPAGEGCPPSPCPPPSPWGGDGWQTLQSPHPGTEGTQSDDQLPPSSGRGFSPARGNSGDNAAGGADELPSFMGQEWGSGNNASNGAKPGNRSVWSALEDAGGGAPGDQPAWGLGLPPPGGGGVSDGEGDGGAGQRAEDGVQGTSMQRLLRDAFSSLRYEICILLMYICFSRP